MKVVFLDRDGTLIEDRHYLNHVSEICYLPHTFEALRIFRDMDYQFIVVTNQSGIPRGLVDLSSMHSIHEEIAEEGRRQGVEILHFYYAPFMPDTNHEWRKPKPGMLKEAQKDFQVDMAKSWMIGDRMTDVEAGRRAGVRSILLGHLDSPETSEFSPPDGHVQSLLEAARFVEGLSS